jgi:hypothetical protein
MRIRWDTGEEATTTIASQSRIVRNMDRDAAFLELERAHPVTRPLNVPASHIYQTKESVRCAKCGRYTDRPEYYEGEPYGSDCIRHVRGKHRQTREYISPSYDAPPKRQPQGSWLETAAEVVIAIGGLAFLLLTSKPPKRRK